MPRQAVMVAQHGFNKGELSPDLHGRKDWAGIAKGLKRAQNVIVRVTGGVVKAPGTRFVAPALEQGRTCRLIPFEFGTEQTYILEFGERRFRVLHDGGVVLFPAGHAKAGQEVILDSPFTLSQMQSAEIRVDAGVRSADYAQENDTLILVHATMPPKILTRHAHHDWRWSEFSAAPVLSAPTGLTITADGGWSRSYMVTALGKNSIGANVESFPSNMVTTDAGESETDTGIASLSWTAVSGATGYRVYREFDTDDGYQFQSIGETSGTTYTDNDAEEGDKDVTPPKRMNPFDAPGKYPSIAQFDKNRLWMGAPTAQPNQLNGSRLGEFRHFDLPDLGVDEYGNPEETDAADACEWMVSGGKSTPTLLWLAAHTEGLVMGSPTGEYIMRGEEPAIDPRISLQSWYGCTAVKPILFNEAIVTVGATRESVFAWSFNSIDVRYSAKDLSLYSQHIFQGKRVVATAAQRNPYYNIFAALSDGTLAVITFEAREDQIGVTRRETAGKFETVESLANINGSTDIYFQTAREINGVTRRYIEIMATHHFPGMPLEDAWYVDCGVEYRGAAKKTFTGLSHLEGRKISVLADGVDYGASGRDIIVKNGSFTLPMPAGHVIAGLPYTAEIETLDLAPQGMEATVRNRAPVTATVSFYHTRDCRVSCSGSDEEDLDFLDSDGETTALKELTSKTYVVPADPDGSLSSSITLSSGTPLPWGVCRIDAVVLVAQTNNQLPQRMK